jgi:uncharacterized OB-fold protein
MQMNKAKATEPTPQYANSAAGLDACKCTECGRVYFPKRVFCTECGSDRPMLEYLLTGPGKLYSHSLIHAAPKAFAPPYAVGYVDLPENVRVLGQIVGWRNSSLDQGTVMAVERGAIAKDPDGTIRESFVFRPVN